MTKTKKIKIFNKCNGHCAYCGKLISENMMTVDHKVAKKQGGKSEIENLLPCCQKCNKEKGDLSLDTYRLKLVWESLTIKELGKFKNAMAAARKHKFYFEKNNDKPNAD